MGKVKPSSNKAKKRKVARRAELSNPADSKQDPQSLLAAAVAYLQQGQPDAALPLAQRAADGAHSKQLLAFHLIGEINVELGDPESALLAFSKCADLDPDGTVPEEEGGGAEKFFWLAQLSESGGVDSLRWYERGARVLENAIVADSAAKDPVIRKDQEERRKKLATALCGMCEVWMTDLSFVPVILLRIRTILTNAGSKTKQKTNVKR